MARCPNKNTAEYKALQKVYKSEIATNNVINSWQDTNDTDEFPTVAEAEQFLKYNKVAFALKQKSFAESLLNNLRDKKLIHNEFGLDLVNASDPNVFYTERVANKNIAKDNRIKILKYLKANNIPEDAVLITETEKTFKIKVLDNMFTPKDILPSSRAWDTPRSQAVVMHLIRMFPEVKVKMLSPTEAEALYNTIPKWDKSKVNFKNVNSFYYNNIAYLVRGRVTNETAIEEMLHPFTDAIKMDNPELFNGLLTEAKANFPEMVQSITQAYNANRNFNQLERDLEIVTQALSRHFNNEYETTPTQSFLNKIKEALEWFMKVINNLNEYITGKPLSVKNINNKTTFTDIAKLLNTEGIRFKLNLNLKTNTKVRYSLSPEKQKIVNIALNEATAIQQEIIKRLFHVALNSEKEVDSLSVNLSNIDSPSTIVVLNKADHTYVDIVNNLIYKSVTTAIKGQLTAEQMLENKLNLDVGNDIDAMFETVVSKLPFEEIFSKLKTIDRETALKIFDILENMRPFVIPSGSVGISQVVLFDEATQLAGTADLIVIDGNGKIKIVDLKTSKNSIFEETVQDIIKNKIPGRKQGRKYTNVLWKLNEDILVKDENGNPVLDENGKPKILHLGSDLKKLHGVDTLSTEGQHNLQVNMYRRMLENMGYTVDNGDDGATTLHIKVDITGKGVNQKFNNNIKPEGQERHTLESQNKYYVDLLLPSNVNNKTKEQINRDIESSENVVLDENIDVEAFENDIDAQDEISDTIEAQQYPEYNAIQNALEMYSVALIEEAKAMDKVKSSIFRDKTKQEAHDAITLSLAYIASNINTGPIARSQTYTNLLRSSLNEMQKFTKYVEDPANVNKPEYITYVLNFDRFLSTFNALYSIMDSKELNTTQRTLVLQMQLEHNKLDVKNKNEGLINDAIINYVKEIIRTRTNKDFGGKGSFFTEEMLDELMISADDIAVDALQAQDMATQKDTILAVMDKIYKIQKYKLQDKIKLRESIIRKAGNEILKLSANKDKKTLYNFMLEYNKDGQFSGFYTQKIGQQYYEIQNKLRAALYDDNGNPYVYRDVIDTSTAKPEDIKYNQDLAEKKAAFGAFFNVEFVDEGTLVDGEYHKLSDEFKTARNKYEYFQLSQNKKFGNWFRKPNINDADYALYQSKYYDFTKYTRALKVNGVPTGVVLKDQTFRAPKVEFRVIRETSGTGKDMRSEKYASIMDPTKTDALSIAQRNFYNLFVQYYETELLSKLPESVKTQMSGRIPIIQSNILNDLKNKPNIVTRMYADTVRSIKNFTQETATQKNVLLDENGNFVNSLPIYYTGKIRVDKELESAEAEIIALQDKKKKGLIAPDAYNKQLAILNGKAAQLRSQPSLGELNTDVASVLIAFSGMAEHYEVMGEIEDTLTAMVNVIEKRTYNYADPAIITGTRIDSKFKKVGTIKGVDSRVLKRAKKYMSMVYYDNELATKGVLDKVADGLMEFGSLAHVAANPFGNFNNYVMGRINNSIETLGSRFYDRKDMLRAIKEYNTKGISGILSRTSAAGIDLGDIATLGKLGVKKSDYDGDLPNNIYEALVDHFGMMDKVDQRESIYKSDSQSIWSRLKEWGYVLQDAAEYNVQTKVGVAVLMGITIKNSKTGETLSLYDAFTYNSVTHKPELKDGYDTIVEKNGNEKPYTDQFRYETRNNIREVNKQIHGNYAKDDRMVLQSNTFGNLITQFHKWVAPAIRSRWRREYFDENLGWLEGRYRSFYKFLNHVKGEIVRGNIKINPKNYHQSFLDAYGFTGEGGNLDQRAEDKLQGFYRTTGEIGIILSIYVLNSILSGILAGDDDDDETTTRFKNLAKLQADRTLKEMILFTPTTGGASQLYQMGKSPVAATSLLGSMGEALSLSVRTPFNYIIQTDEEFRANKDLVYQNAPHEGELKVYKNWKDVIPVLYSIQKWDDMLRQQEFYIK